jgi:hypothetical protein
MSAGPETIFKADGKNAIHDGIEHEAGGGKALLDPTDTAFLLLDHQSGLFQNVKDISVAELRANVTALAKVAALQRIPVITTASEPNGPNGPLMPEIQEAAPHTVLCAAQGRGQCVGQRAVREDGARNGEENAGHGRRMDQRVRDVPRAGRESGRIQGLRGDRRFRRPE